MPRVHAHQGAHAHQAEKATSAGGVQLRGRDEVIDTNAAGPGACWVGMHEGHVAATDRSLGRLIARLKKSGIPVEEATFRFAGDGAKAKSRAPYGQRT